jgi:hypothetical protein
VLVSGKAKGEVFVPTIRVKVVRKFKNQTHKWVVEAYANANLNSRAVESRFENNRLLLNETDIDGLKLQRTSLESKTGHTTSFDILQNVPAHEFGHALGLKHPGHVVQEADWPRYVYDLVPATGMMDNEAELRRRRAYYVDPFSLMGMGNYMRGPYFAEWVRYLNEKEPQKAPWKAVAQLQPGLSPEQAFIARGLLLNTKLSYQQIVGLANRFVRQQLPLE